MKVAILDDNRYFATVLKEILKLKGHEVNVYYCGLVMNESAFVKTADIVIVDIHLPTICGVSVIKELKESGALGEIVAISVDYTDSILEKLKLLGVKYLLRKPFTYEQLEKILMILEEAKV